MSPGRPPEPHLCLAPRALTTVEHLGAVARQARSVGFETCWLDLGDQEGVAASVHAYAEPGARLESVDDDAALRRHLRRSKSTAVWMQTPYPEHYPAWFPAAAEGLLAYSGYGLTLSTWDAGLFALETYRSVAWILTESERERDGYLRYGADPARVLTTGNPLLYELRAALVGAPPPVEDLLWAPHWTEDWFGRRGYARWRETVHDLHEHARREPSFRLRVRPHPLLVASVATAHDDTDALAYRELVALPNVTESEGRLVDDIAESAALLTEGVSIIAYWSSTGRPLGIVRDDDSPPFNAAGEALVRAADRLADPVAVREWLAGLGGHTTSGDRRALSELIHPTFGPSPVALWDGEGRRHVRVRDDAALDR